MFGILCMSWNVEDNMLMAKILRLDKAELLANREEEDLREQIGRHERSRWCHEEPNFV